MFYRPVPVGSCIELRLLITAPRVDLGSTCSRGCFSGSRTWNLFVEKKNRDPCTRRQFHVSVSRSRVRWGTYCIETTSDLLIIGPWRGPRNRCLPQLLGWLGLLDGWQILTATLSCEWFKTCPRQSHPFHLGIEAGESTMRMCVKGSNGSRRSDRTSGVNMEKNWKKPLMLLGIGDARCWGWVIDAMRLIHRV